MVLTGLPIGACKHSTLLNTLFKWVNTDGIIQMSEYRRWRVAGGTFFFTVVTHQRSPLFNDATSRRFLREAFLNVKERRPFEVIAIVLLPDHFHMI